MCYDSRVFIKAARDEAEGCRCKTGSFRGVGPRLCARRFGLFRIIGAIGRDAVADI